MSAPEHTQQSPALQADLTLGGLLALFLRHWLPIGVTTVVAAGLAAWLAFWMTPIYRSEVVLSPTDHSGSGGTMAQLVGRIGSLGSLAGVGLGAGSSMRAESVAMLKSRALTEDFIRNRNLLPVLYAEQWDAQRGGWATLTPPTLAGAVEDFNEDVRSVIEDRRTGLVTLRMEWSDPALAATWANEYVAAANETVRKRAIADAERTLQYLDAELTKTRKVSVQQAIYSLIEQQINAIAVANVQEEFAFKVVDPAAPAEAQAGGPPFNVSTAASDRVYAITIIATDLLGLQSSKTFTVMVLNVKATPVARTLPDLEVIEGDVLQYSAPPFSDADGDLRGQASPGVTAGPRFGGVSACGFCQLRATKGRPDSAGGGQMSGC